MFPLDSWIRLHNMLVASNDRRLSRDARLVYILVIKGAFQLVKLIIEDVSWRPDTGNFASEEQHRTLLGAETDSGDYQMLEILLKMGVSPSTDARDQQSRLSLAVSKGDVAICQRLMTARANANDMSMQRRPSDLRLANKSGCLEIVRALLQHPKYAHHVNSSFESDLKFAIGRYAESTCRFEELVPLINNALERPGATIPDPHPQRLLHT